MPYVNYLTREINCRIVYYGPACGGKTTNLLHIHGQLDPSERTDLVSIPTASDRTLFFEFLKLDFGQVHGWKVRPALYTVPGQVEHNSSRKLILNGADAVVFVADSDPQRSADNIESLNNLNANLKAVGISPDHVPFVLQYNKRDLSAVAPVADMEQQLNWRHVPSFEAVAIAGKGVMTTLNAVKELLLKDLAKLVS